jgi:pimeloyl-ACP methyl ester carboxylesterase
VGAVVLGAMLMPAVRLRAEAVDVAQESRQAGLGGLIVVGFMGGNVDAGNMVHPEAVLARQLQERYPAGVHAAVFANRDWRIALDSVLALLDTDGDGRLSESERKAARIVIYGHSWGASETVMLARRLNELGIPVLLTVQIDSVEKSNEDDGTIPPNVREAVNFYQSEGLLHGRKVITAVDPTRTKILGNYASSYKQHPVSCAAYPWYARAFMKAHIEIENDPRVWSRIEALIRNKVI